VRADAEGARLLWMGREMALEKCRRARFPHSGEP
jgi:hypothetical protein